MPKTKEFFLRLIILFVGLCIAHLGVTLFLQADLGSDPFNVLVQGIFRKAAAFTGWNFLTHGRTHIAICILIIAVLLFVDRSYIKAGTLACMIFARWNRWRWHFDLRFFSGAGRRYFYAAKRKACRTDSAKKI